MILREIWKIILSLSITIGGVYLLLYTLQGVGAILDKPQHEISRCVNTLQITDFWCRPTTAEEHTLMYEKLLTTNISSLVDFIPDELLTISLTASDPYIYLETAYFQAARVAKARKLTIHEVMAQIKQYTSTMPLTNRKVVNVPLLNAALSLASASAKY